jgi:hypothetical protein
MASHATAGTPANPFSDYTEADMLEYLGNLTALHTRGSFLYSNLAFGVHGALPSLAANTP